MPSPHGVCRSKGSPRRHQVSGHRRPSGGSRGQVHRPTVKPDGPRGPVAVPVVRVRRGWGPRNCGQIPVNVATRVSSGRQTSGCVGSGGDGRCSGVTAAYSAALIVRPNLLAAPCGFVDSRGEVPREVATVIAAVGARDVASGLAMALVPAGKPLQTALAVRVMADPQRRGDLRCRHTRHIAGLAHRRVRRGVGCAVRGQRPPHRSCRAHGHTRRAQRTPTPCHRAGPRLTARRHWTVRALRGQLECSKTPAIAKGCNACKNSALTTHPGRGIGLHPPAHTVRTEQTSLIGSRHRPMLHPRRGGRHSQDAGRSTTFQ